MGLTMAFRRSDLQEAFFVPGTQPFRVYGYGTNDPLEAVLAPGYFEHARGLLRPGELIYVSTGLSVTPGSTALDPAFSLGPRVKPGRDNKRER